MNDTTERFETEIARHAMTVIRDDGEYRHLRFSRPHTRAMSFDLLTWPGHQQSREWLRAGGTLIEIELCASSRL